MSFSKSGLAVLVAAAGSSAARRLAPENVLEITPDITARKEIWADAFLMGIMTRIITDHDPAKTSTSWLTSWLPARPRLTAGPPRSPGRRCRWRPGLALGRARSARPPRDRGK